MKEIVIATRNPGKLEEFKVLMKDLVAAPNGKILLESDGICDGMLLHEPLGTEGFGYDPLFWSTELHKGMGEATMQEKNKISHRGKAIKKLVANWGKMK